MLRLEWVFNIKLSKTLATCEIFVLHTTLMKIKELILTAFTLVSTIGAVFAMTPSGDIEKVSSNVELDNICVSDTVMPDTVTPAQLRDAHDVVRGRTPFVGVHLAKL